MQGVVQRVERELGGPVKLDSVGGVGVARPATHRGEVPRPRPTDVSLESIDLDGEEGQLELFLREDCPDLSPLPRDEVSTTWLGSL